MKHSMNQTTEAFFALLRAGLWEKGTQLLPYEPLDFDGIYQIADDQSVVGLVAAGLEHVEDRKIVKPEALPFLKKVFAQEGRNASMNAFIGSLVEKMRDARIYSLLIKGQGIAQCYSRPQWRSAGDVDFLLDDAAYEKAKVLLLPLASSSLVEGKYVKEQEMTIDSWSVELHGTLRTGLSKRIDRLLDQVQGECCGQGAVRAWNNGGCAVFLPAPMQDVFVVFTHIIKHFYKGGIGLRQICDWCRLLWIYRETVDKASLESRLRSMGLLSEWRGFAAFAVDSLGMPKETMPLYDSSSRWSRKARRIQAFILEVGNFGHNRDMSYYHKYPYVIRKVISFGQRCGDLIRHAAIFPLESVRFFPSIVWNGVRNAARGE